MFFDQARRASTDIPLQPYLSASQEADKEENLPAGAPQSGARIHFVRRVSLSWDHTKLHVSRQTPRPLIILPKLSSRLRTHPQATALRRHEPTKPSSPSIIHVESIPPNHNGINPT
mmetsp:Transcript_130821/g.226378  ORF Transcript_130821/g.226378 Transcript_130821/m.226378 type:complete len:116 (-) Transcript_130821:15-362(-)